MKTKDHAVAFQMFVTKANFSVFDSLMYFSEKRAQTIKEKEDVFNVHITASILTVCANQSKINKYFYMHVYIYIFGGAGRNKKTPCEALRQRCMLLCMFVGIAK